MSMKRCLISSLGMMALAIGTVSTLGVHPALASRSSASATPVATTPQAPIEALYKALDKSEHSSANMSKRSAMIAPFVERAFDMESILKRSIGLHYDHLSTAEKNDLLAAFKHFTVARYVSTFKPGTDAVFTVVNTIQRDGRTIVHSTIGGKDDPNGTPTPIDYVMAQGPDGWRITDILLDGHISQVAAQRADFKTIFNEKGANGLARSLTTKADDFLRE